MSKKPAFQSAIRVQDSLLAGLERRLLVWVAHRMPGAINSDHLTVLGLAGMVMAGVSYYIAASYNPLALLLGIFFLAINWFGDSLDGTLARVRDRQRPRYGFYVDHVVDIFGAVFLIGGLGVSGYMSGAVAMALLIVYLMLSAEIYLATHALGVFRLSFGLWGPTELRILLAIGNVALLFKPLVSIRGELYRLCDVGGVIAIISLGAVLLASILRNTLTLYQQERLP